MSGHVNVIARALCEEWDKTFNHEDPESFDRLAKAAVSAMRDPTEEMVEAGDGARFDLSAIFVWQAMIDKLLDKDRG